MLLLTCRKNANYALYFLAPCIFVYLNLSIEAMSIYATLLVCDTITWFLKSWFVTKNSSSKWLIVWTVSKFLLFSVPMVIALMVKWLWYDSNSLVVATLWVLIVAEAYSVIQNIVCIKLWKEIPEYDAISVALWRILENTQVALENQMYANKIKRKTDDTDKETI